MNLTTLLTLGVPAIFVLTFLAGLFRWFRRRGKQIGEFLDDWNGTPARPGVPERPGVMTRLERLETRVAAVDKELKPNGGSSFRDAVMRAATGTTNPPTP